MNITEEMVEKRMNWEREHFGANPNFLRVRWRDMDSKSIRGIGKTIVAIDNIPDWAYVMVAMDLKIKKTD